MASRFVISLMSLACAVVLLSASCTAQSQLPKAQSPVSVQRLERSLRDYLKKDFLANERIEVWYFVAFVDLNGDGKEEAIVHTVSAYTCGTGGCPTLVLTLDDSAYRVVTDISITRPPIRVLSNSSHGWRNLAVWVQGGGIIAGYEAELRFDGITYPSNPSLPPARRLEISNEGDIVIPKFKSNKQGALLVLSQ